MLRALLARLGLVDPPARQLELALGGDGAGPGAADASQPRPGSAPRRNRRASGNGTGGGKRVMPDREVGGKFNAGGAPRGDAASSLALDLPDLPPRAQSPSRAHPPSPRAKPTAPPRSEPTSRPPAGSKQSPLDAPPVAPGSPARASAPPSASGAAAPDTAWLRPSRRTPPPGRAPRRTSRPTLHRSALPPTIPRLRSDCCSASSRSDCAGYPRCGSRGTGARWSLSAPGRCVSMRPSSTPRKTSFAPSRSSCRGAVRHEPPRAGSLSPIRFRETRPLALTAANGCTPTTRRSQNDSSGRTFGSTRSGSAARSNRFASRCRGRMSTRLGHYAPERSHPGGAEIAISRRHIRRHGWREAFDTLLHEMVHQWQEEHGHPIDHGPLFRKKAREVGTTPRARRVLR